MNSFEQQAFEHIDNASIKYLNEIIIDDEFINFRDKEAKRNQRYDQNKRTEETLKLHADCTILEHYLIKNQIVQPPNHRWRHDFRLFNLKIDAKNINKKYFSVPNNKIIQYLESIKLHELTHFMFWKYNTNPSTPFKSGDNVSFTILNLVHAQEVMNNLRVSKFNIESYYYEVNCYEKAA